MYCYSFNFLGAISANLMWIIEMKHALKNLHDGVAQLDVVCHITLHSLDIVQLNSPNITILCCLVLAHSDI